MSLIEHPCEGVREEPCCPPGVVSKKRGAKRTSSTRGDGSKHRRKLERERKGHSDFPSLRALGLPGEDWLYGGRFANVGGTLPRRPKEPSWRGSHWGLDMSITLSAMAPWAGRLEEFFSDAKQGGQFLAPVSRDA